MELPPHIKKPKLCSLRRWETFSGYGFNLHSDKGKQGQIIGKVDPNSPAELGGLCSHDVLIEVNGINVEGSSHNIVVGRVKSIPNRVDLFVCHPDTYTYCKENSIVLSSALHNIEEYTTPERQPAPVEERKQQQQQQQQQQRQSTDDASAEEAVAILKAAIEASGGVEFEEVTPQQLPERFRFEEPEDLHNKQSNMSSQRTPSPPPSFTAATATAQQPARTIVAAPAATAAAAAAATPAATPPSYNPPPPKQQQQPQPQQQPLQQQRQQQQHQNQQPKATGSNKSDPVGNVSLEDVRARVGQNKRNQVKMINSTFSEKYSMFESL